MVAAAQPRVLASVAQMLLRAAAMAGLDRAALLSQAGLDEMEIAERDTHIALPSLIRLGESIIERLPGVNLALHIGRAFTPDSIGVLGDVLRNSPTVGDALADFLRYQQFMSDGIHWTLSREPDGAEITVRLDPALEALVHPVEAQFAIWMALSRKLAGRDWRPRAVSFCHGPIGDPAEHAAFFGVPVTFRADRNALFMAPQVLSLQNRSARPERRALLLRHLESIVREVDRHGEVSRQVRAALARQLARGPIKQAELAASLGMSSRTLSRRLKHEGTTFGDQLDRVRHELALSYLCDPAIAVYEVAFLLGYTEPSTFHRAFKRWTGHTPLVYRRHHAAS